MKTHTFLLSGTCVFVLFLTGCKSEVECGSEDSKNLLNTVIEQSAINAIASDSRIQYLTANERDIYHKIFTKYISENFDAIKTTSVDKDTGRKSCSANVIFNLKLEKSSPNFTGNVEYNIQMTDDKQKQTIEVNSFTINGSQGDITLGSLLFNLQSQYIAAQQQATNIDASSPLPSESSENDINNSSTNSGTPEAQSTYQTSFNCNQASNYVETTICQNKDLADKDLFLHQIYQQRLNISKNKHDFKQNEKDWVLGTLNMCSNKDCISNAITTRINYLQNINNN